jgi:alkylation response protein AidB-like acyl-CoA dehydrogenase
MSNFYTDNPDLRFCLDGQDMDRAIALREGDFGEAKAYEFAPRDAVEAKEQYEAVLKLAGEICGEFVALRAEIIDKEGNTYRDGEVILHPQLRACIDRFREADLMGLSMPRRFGGLNMPQSVKITVIEMVARADASLMNIVGLQDIAETIETFAPENLKSDVLPGLCDGGDTAAMVFTEPDAGSDLASVRLHADCEDEAKNLWRLNGSKRFITNGCGDVLVVLARSEHDISGARGLSSFLVKKGEGVRIRRIENKLGIHGSPTCEIQFTNAPGHLIGTRKRGLIDAAMEIMNGARIGIAAQAIGIAEAAAREAVRYSESRVQFGKAIRIMPPVYEMLANMRIRIEAARALNIRSAHIVELLKNLQVRANENKATAEEKAELKVLTRLAASITPLSKYFATEMANQVCDDAIQVLGGSGYMKDYPVERYFRDARITNIYEGTTQLQVVGAIGGITSGVLGASLDQLIAKGLSSASKDLFAQVQEMRPKLDEAIALHKENKDQEFRELYARRVVDLALDLYLGALLAEQAARGSERKRALADAFFANMKPRFRENFAALQEGSRVLLEKHSLIVGL